MYLLGYDIGSSSVKASLVEAETGKCVASDFFPKQEMEIRATKAGWAEQDPENWWKSLCLATSSVLARSGVKGEDIKAIGISYQMHGLVVVDKDQKVLRPAIIWCDSRAVPYGEKAFANLGPAWCLSHLLNSPGNFTASKLAWIKANEPEVFARIHKIMLPGDYVAMRLSGKINTTVSGLSEGIFWDFKAEGLADRLLEYYGFDRELIADVVPTFSRQSGVTTECAGILGLKAGTPICYRAGDQPNNALSLNVLQPGEIASTAGTSGVVYGVNDQVRYDPESRINIFAHVNHTAEVPRLGVLHCINGTGILNSWVKKNMIAGGISYDDMNQMAGKIPVGADGLTVLPFGNGAERVLCNREANASFHGINFNIHTRAHLMRAAQEGIVFSFKYGIEVMEQLGMTVHVIKAGHTNMFQSPVFRETLAGVTGAAIELYETDGSVGAAKGAGIGAGIYASAAEAFSTLHKLEVVEPAPDRTPYLEAYARWKALLKY